MFAIDLHLGGSRYGLKGLTKQYNSEKVIYNSLCYGVP